MMTSADRLRQLLAAPGLVQAPCCYDGMSARLIRDAGFPMACVSGFEAAAMSFGLPDTGYLTLTDLTDQMRRITRVVPDLPILADGETGYGNAANVRYTVLEYARAGAAVVMIEDQEWPRRCPFIEGSHVIPRKEARMRIRAAVEAAREAGILILARTDANASFGFDEGLERCLEFQEEGADMIVMEALRTEEEMANFCAALKVPTVTNQHPGIKTPFLTRERVHEIGFKIAAYHPMMLTATRAMQDALAALAADGNYDAAPPQVAFNDMLKLVGIPEYLALEARYEIGK